MEIFLLVVLLIILVVMNNRFGDVKQLVRQQHDELIRLRTDFKEFRTQVSTGLTSIQATTPPTPEASAPVVVVVPELKPIVKPEPVVTPPELVADIESIVSIPPIESIGQPAEPALPQKPEPSVKPGSVRPIPVGPIPAPRVPKLSFFQRFLRDNPDMEKFIGENLMNKIGIAILVLGIGYFVKFAIDQNWINEIGRVFIGVLAGGLLIGIAHRLRTSFGAFSSVLVGGGLSVLYFTIAIAFHEYHIFSQAVAFVLMVVITAFSVLLSIAYNRVELAVVSLVGGFATPFMVSTGAGDYRVLLTYILLLDVGMLVLAYFKKWNLVHIVAYGFTVLLYGAWLSSEVIDMKNAHYMGALLYGTLFYAVFMAMNIIHNLKEQTKFSALEISLLLSNTFFYFTAGMSILADVDQGAYQGLFTVLLAVVNFLLAFFLYRREAVDRNLIYLLIGLVITFVSLAVPVQLEGNFITMFWALETVLLLWFAQKSGLKLVASASVLVMGLMLISLCMDWEALYGKATTPPLPILFNKAFVTSLVSIAGVVGVRFLLKTQENPFQFWLGKLGVATYRRLIGNILGILIYLAGALELNYQLITAVGFGSNRTIVMGSYNLLFAAGLLIIAQRGFARRGLAQGNDNGQLDNARKNLLKAAGLAVLALLIYVSDFNPAVMTLLTDYFLNTEPSFIGFPVHYLSLILFVCIVVLMARIRPTVEPLPPLVTRLWFWFVGIVLVWVASTELMHHVIYFNFAGTEGVSLSSQPKLQQIAASRFNNLLTQTNKVGLPILWGVGAFLFMWYGLNRKIRQLRIISLSLFALTLVKLFLFDIEGISEGGKIAAFISLGVLLLTISFMYQRIRKLILADEASV